MKKSRADTISPGPAGVVTWYEIVALVLSNFLSILNYEPKIILNKTRCLKPCNYIEYKVIGEPTRGNSSQFEFQGIKG